MSSSFRYGCSGNGASCSVHVVKFRAWMLNAVSLKKLALKLPKPRLNPEHRTLDASEKVFQERNSFLKTLAPNVLTLNPKP